MTAGRASRAAAARSARIARACSRNSLAIRVFRRSTARARRASPRLGDQRLVARQELLDLHHVVRQRFGRRVDRRQAAADDDDRHPHLQIGEESVFAAPVNCSAIRKSDAWRTPRTRPFFIGITVGRPAPGAERDMVEAHLEGAVDGYRAAEAHAAIHCELRAPLEQQADDFQEVLVPPDGDAVFGHAAEARPSRARRAARRFPDVSHRRNGTAAMRIHAREVSRQRLDLQAVDADDRDGRRSSDDAHSVKPAGPRPTTSTL